jgi:hypothetical protein
MAEVISSSGVKLVAVIRRFFFEPDNQSNNPITPSITGKKRAPIRYVHRG